MPHNPATTEHPTVEVQSPSGYAYLTGAAVTLAIALMLCLADQYTPVVITRGVFALLAALIVFCGVGYLVRSAECRVVGTLERFGEHRYQAGYDDGFVDGAAEAASKVEGINGRRVRPLTHQ